jgi:hypothetical protein
MSNTKSRLSRSAAIEMASLVRASPSVARRVYAHHTIMPEQSQEPTGATLSLEDFYDRLFKRSQWDRSES